MQDKATEALNATLDRMKRTLTERYETQRHKDMAQSHDKNIGVVDFESGIDAAISTAINSALQRICDVIFEQMESRIGELVEQAAATRVPKNIVEKLDILVKLRVADLQHTLTSAITALSHPLESEPGKYEREAFEREWSKMFTEPPKPSKKRRNRHAAARHK